MNQNTNCNHFVSVAFGINVHLIVHTDDDATYSVEYVNQAGHPYKLIKNILAYSYFPCLEMALALRAGDALILNAHKPHLISSRCNNNDVVYCISMYLKTDVFSLNNNSIELIPMM